jgi:hypothetical protein
MRPRDPASADIEQVDVPSIVAVVDAWLGVWVML